MAEQAKSGTHELLSLNGVLLPHSIEAERSALGCALTNAVNLAEITSILRAEDFYDPRHRLIFEAILSLIVQAKPVDVLTIQEQLRTQQNEEKIGGLPYLSELMNQPFTLKNAAEYAQIVREKAILRQMSSQFHRFLGMTMRQEESSDQLMSLAVSSLYNISQNRDASGMEKISDILARKLEELADPTPKSKAMPSGFSSLDHLLGGFGKGTLTILAARPAMGKSAFALNIATHIAVEQKATVAVFSLEMGKEELATRIMASYACIPASDLQNQKIAVDDWSQISSAFHRFIPINLYIDDRSGTTPSELMSKCRQLKLEKNLQLIVIDYLQLMNAASSNSQSRQQEISEISRSLKILAKELEVPIIALSQLSRACELRTNKTPMLSDLRESGSLEQDADMVLFLYREQYYAEEKVESEVQEAEVIIAKNRAGSTGKVKLGWIPKYTKFFNLETTGLEPPAYSPPLQDFNAPEPPPPPPEAGFAIDPVDLPF